MVFPVADAHCDFLYGAVQWGYDIANRAPQQVTALSEFSAGHVALQFFACWTDTSLKAPPLHQCVSMIDAYRRMIKKNDALVPFTGDFDPACGKTACVLTVEGGEAAEGSLAVLRTLHALGVRAMTLTWNESNELSGAALQKTRRGLTALGREMIAEMNRIGIAVDLAHLSDAGIEDVLAISTRPVFASHSNARSVFSSPRSLTDELIRAIAGQGGVIGINFYNKQLTARPIATVDDVIKQILHVVEIGGVNCCAIGSDFDGMQRYPKGLETAAGFPALFDRLLESGLTPDDVGKIAYWNLHRYISLFV